MAAQPSYKTYTYTVPAGGSVQIERTANFVSCLDAQAPFHVTFDMQPETEFEAGLTFFPVETVSRVEIINKGGTENRVTLAFGKGRIEDARLTIGNQVKTAAQSPNTLTTGAPVNCGDGATTMLAADNGNRAEIMVANDGAGKVYIGGDGTAAAGQGMPLEAGGVMVLTTTAAVYARNDSGAAVAVAVAEMERA